VDAPQVLLFARKVNAMQFTCTLDEDTFVETARPMFLSCKNLIGAGAGYIAKVSAGAGQIDVLFVEPTGAAINVANYPGMPVRDLHDEVLRSGRAVFRNDLSESDHLQHSLPGHQFPGNVLAAPLFIRNKISGLFGFTNKPGGFSEDDARVASAFSEIAAVALSNARIGESCGEALHFIAQRALWPPSEPNVQNSHMWQEDQACPGDMRRLSRERLKLNNILNSMHDGVYIIDLNYNIQYTNPAIIGQFGHVNGRKCYEYFHDLNAPCAWCKNDRVSKTKFEMWEYRSAKTNKTYEVFSTPFLNEDGTVAKLDIMRDVTWRQEAERALSESEARYRTLVETMNEGLVVMNDRNECTYSNGKLCEMLGYSYDEILGQTPDRFVDKTNLKTLDEQMAKRRTGVSQPYDITFVHRNGSLVHTLVSPRAVFDAAGQFAGSFAVVTDITQRKNTEASLLKALSEIKLLKDRVEAENIFFRKEINFTQSHGHIIGQSNALKYVLYRAEQVAPTDATVLIMGETGTGKGLLATAIHKMSQRSGRPMVTVNCAALPAGLIESELFGRERGAFTGSDARQIGRFEVADGSTICLDEISELPLGVQAKLLRVIQDNAFERLGSSRTLQVNARILATTNRNLEQEVREGRFREDLFYRLNVFPLTIPALRKRKEDIPLLVQALTERFGRKMGKRFSSVSRETMQRLQEYDWPGNIRELENFIERAIILCPGPNLRLTDELERTPVSSGAAIKTLEAAERDHILKTLSETCWQIGGPNGAAAILNLPPSTLRSRMQKLNITRPEVQTPRPRYVAAATTCRGRGTSNLIHAVP